MPVSRSAWSLSRVAWFSIGQPPGESAGQRNTQDREGSHALPEKASTAARATADGPESLGLALANLPASLLGSVIPRTAKVLMRYRRRHQQQLGQRLTVQSRLV